MMLVPPRSTLLPYTSLFRSARSLRGGVLWTTPLVAEAGGTPVATAQGALLVSGGGEARGSYAVETTARSPEGGLLEGDLPRSEEHTSEFQSRQYLVCRLLLE